MTFKTEQDFENSIITYLFDKGWEKNVLKYKTEEDLIQNWANILFENNREIDRLDSYPLTKGEMSQIIEQINTLKTPMKLNGFINGKTISIVRDNPDDKAHFGKEISLKIYDRQEIAAGQSRYQIAEQPEFKKKHPLGHDRRGDFMLLINGMPLIHVELKKDDKDVSKACGQIEKYSKEGIFTGLFSLVQVFVAMTPNETLYFANPGPDGKFNPDFYFHWANFNNEPMNEWTKIASSLLCIPMAHQLIGFYTVADDTDGVLKVMRSYQYYAANAISDKVAKTKWADKSIYGGYIWHTTGSGKTMTSFKSAQLIANSKDADKVVFLMDRIELGTQSLIDYRAFADDSDDVQATENSHVLLSKLKSSNPNEVLIVTSIQKMSRIQEDEGFNKKDIDLINAKRIVFIIDECHRSTFGEMLTDIKNTFPGALFFGFTGTPIHDENQKKLNTTADIFGDELHRYTIADGIRDHNVLGFDPYRVSTYSESDLREAVGLEKARAKDLTEVFSNESKKKIYLKYQDEHQVPMAGFNDSAGKYIHGIEDEINSAQYERIEHQKVVVDNILKNWLRLSQGKKFSAIFATSSIKEACEYFELIQNNKDNYTGLQDL
ncbi:MAG: DEAD/DEAH box helicase family protein, partial [Bacteroidaceae bacterium]|nr:DEAD/DEAH box helicase family protein [Bacteroidaceae bacterium]